MFVRKKSLNNLALPCAVLLVAFLLGTPLSYAAGKGKHHHDAKGAMPHGHAGHSMAGMAGGQPGKASEVTRTIVITAKDTVFSLKSIKVKADETIKFIIDNKGQLLHEFTIGTASMQKQHQAEMMKMTMAGKLLADRVVGDVKHAHGNSVLVEPKKKKEIIWKFAESATLEFGCNLPGHYESGMKGKFLFKG
jgi:uncharacterized cupredoxin-like copper-binding protein